MGPEFELTLCKHWALHCATFSGGPISSDAALSTAAVGNEGAAKPTAVRATTA